MTANKDSKNTFKITVSGWDENNLKKIEETRVEFRTLVINTYREIVEQADITYSYGPFPQDLEDAVRRAKERLEPELRTGFGKQYSKS